MKCGAVPEKSAGNLRQAREHKKERMADTKENIEKDVLFLYVSISGREKGMVDNYAIIENYLMIRMPEEIDHHRAVLISRTADDYIAHSKIVNIVFDFEDTKFMDSSGIGVIMGRYKKISCFGGKVFAINTSRRIRQLLAVSGMQKLITIME